MSILNDPAEAMFKNLEPEILKGLREFGIINIDFAGDHIEFKHSGRQFRLQMIEVQANHSVRITQSKISTKL